MLGLVALIHDFLPRVFSLEVNNACFMCFSRSILKISISVEILFAGLSQLFGGTVR